MQTGQHRLRGAMQCTWAHLLSGHAIVLLPISPSSHLRLCQECELIGLRGRRCLRPRDRLRHIRPFVVQRSSIHSGTELVQRVDYLLSVSCIRGPHLGPTE